MAWTYTDSPATVPRDEVRFLIGDIVETAEETLSDAEVDYLLTRAADSVYRAAHAGCLRLAARYARRATSKSVGDMSLSYADRAAALREVAAGLLSEMARVGFSGPWVDPDALLRAEDRVDPGSNGTEFQTGQFDNPQVGYGRSL